MSTSDSTDDKFAEFERLESDRRRGLNLSYMFFCSPTSELHEKHLRDKEKEKAGQRASQPLYHERDGHDDSPESQNYPYTVSSGSHHGLRDHQELPAQRENDSNLTVTPRPVS